jgi:cytochrome b
LRGDRPHYVGHNPAGSLAIWAILILAGLTGLSGYATYNEFGGDALEEVHEFLANAWLMVVGMHIAGVVVSSLLDHENLARAMITGYKRAEPAAAIRSGVYGLGSLVLISVLGFWGWTLVVT